MLDFVCDDLKLPWPWLSMELLQMFNAGLQNLRDDGQYDEIVSTYLGQGASTVAITRRTPANDRTNADSVTFDVTFSEAVTGVDAADFLLALSDTVGANANVVVDDNGDTDAKTYTVTIAADSTDANYDGLAPVVKTFTSIDND